MSVCILFNNVSCCAVSFSSVWTSGGATGRSWPQSAPSAAMSRTWSRESRWWENITVSLGFAVSLIPVLASGIDGETMCFPYLDFFCATVQPYSSPLLREQFPWLCRFCSLPLSVSLTAGIPLQNAFRVRPFPHQRCHPGERLHGGNQELPGREVHSPRPNESRWDKMLKLNQSLHPFVCFVRKIVTWGNIHWFDKVWKHLCVFQHFKIFVAWIWYFRDTFAARFLSLCLFLTEMMTKCSWDEIPAVICFYPSLWTNKCVVLYQSWIKCYCEPCNKPFKWFCFCSRCELCSVSWPEGWADPRGQWHRAGVQLGYVNYLYMFLVLFFFQVFFLLQSKKIWTPKGFMETLDGVIFLHFALHVIIYKIIGWVKPMKYSHEVKKKSWFSVVGRGLVPPQ